MSFRDLCVGPALGSHARYEYTLNQTGATQRIDMTDGPAGATGCADHLSHDLIYNPITGVRPEEWGIRSERSGLDITPWLQGCQCLRSTGASS